MAFLHETCSASVSAIRIAAVSKRPNIMARRKRKAHATQSVALLSDETSAAPTGSKDPTRPSTKKAKTRIGLSIEKGGKSVAATVDNPTISISASDHDAILELLQSMDWTMAKNISRRNVIRSDDPSTPRNQMNKPYCMSFIFGRNMKDPTGGLSWWSTQYPHVYQQLRSLMSRYDSSFSYTHITLNRNLRCKRHTDGGNAGPSYIAAFGRFSGGGLLVEAPGGGKPESVCNLHSQFVKFNGKTQPHETMPFTGERYTLVYYTSDIVPALVDRRNGCIATTTTTTSTTAAASSIDGVNATFAQKFLEIKSKLGRKNR